jgi:hypothetical protein
MVGSFAVPATLETKRMSDEIRTVFEFMTLPGVAGRTVSTMAQKALRKSLLKYQLHQDADMLERAYGCIRQ